MTNFNGFKFSGPKIEDFDLPRIGAEIGVGEDVIHAVMDVEAAGKSTDSKGRLKALYEPHVAYRNSAGTTRAALVKAKLAYPEWMKAYPADSYPRIEKAKGIDETVALLATSWAFPQILGENHRLAGYPTPQAMVLDFQKDEDNQLEAMIRFIKNSGLDDELRVIEAKMQRGQRITPDDARPFVRGYNGKGYEANDYHTKFANACNRWAKIPDTPYNPATDAPATGDDDLRDDLAEIETGEVDLYDGNYHAEIEAMQKRLAELGYPEFGKLDGKWGTKTRAALLAFKADNNLPLTPIVDDKLMAALMVAKPRYVNPARKDATVADLRKEGAPEVAAADTTQIAGAAATTVGVVGTAGAVVKQFEEYGGLFKRVADVVEPVKDFLADNFFIIALVLGAVVVWKSGVLKAIRVKKHQNGEDVSM